MLWCKYTYVNLILYALKELDQEWGASYIEDTWYASVLSNKCVPLFFIYYVYVFLNWLLLLLLLLLYEI